MPKLLTGALLSILSSFSSYSLPVHAYPVQTPGNETLQQGILNEPSSTVVPTKSAVWQLVTSPNVGTYSNTLDDIEYVSLDDIWAVGLYQDENFVSRTLTEHWNGLRWSVIPSPNMDRGDLPYNRLTGVAAISHEDVWAVGYYSYYDKGRTTYRPITMHWDGTDWKIVDTPNHSGSYFGGDFRLLSAVAAALSDDVWAVGYIRDGSKHQPIIEHWDGNAWSIVPDVVGKPMGYLRAVTAISADDVWAVGDYYANYSDTSGWQTLIAHWDGNSWRTVPSPNINGPGGANDNRLYGIAAVSPSDIWAVGSYDLSGTVYGQPLLLHWDGNLWSIIPSPDIGITRPTSRLYEVAAASEKDVWAVGYSADPTPQSLILHWNGAQWAVVPGGKVPRSSGLSAVTAVAENDVWAVGNSGSCFHDDLNDDVFFKEPCNPNLSGSLSRPGKRTLIEHTGSISRAPDNVPRSGAGTETLVKALAEAGVVSLLLIVCGLLLRQTRYKPGRGRYHN